MTGVMFIDTLKHSSAVWQRSVFSVKRFYFSAVSFSCFLARQKWMAINTRNATLI